MSCDDMVMYWFVYGNQQLWTTAVSHAGVNFISRIWNDIVMANCYETNVNNQSCKKKFKVYYIDILFILHEYIAILFEKNTFIANFFNFPVKSEKVTMSLQSHNA